MTDENKALAPSLADEQIQLLRNSLINAAFGKYRELIDVLKKLPINQGIPGIIQAYLFIDSGMLWFKEILNTTALVFAQPEQPAPVAPDAPVQPVEEAAPEVMPDNA